MALTGIWYVIGFAFAAGSFTFLTFGAAWLLSHRNRGDVHKGLPYESGIDTYGDTHGRFGLSFYIYALLFVAFDIEVVFIYLWALIFRDPPSTPAPCSSACWSSSRSCCSASPTPGARASSAGAGRARRSATADRPRASRLAGVTDP